MHIDKSSPIKGKLAETEEPTFGLLKGFIFWNYGFQFPVGVLGWLRREKGEVRGLHNAVSLSPAFSVRLTCPSAAQDPIGAGSA